MIFRGRNYGTFVCKKPMFLSEKTAKRRLGVMKRRGVEMLFERFFGKNKTFAGGKMAVLANIGGGKSS